MKLKDIFIANLKFYRKQKGLTQNDLTLALNKSYNYINSIEQGKMLPSFDVIEQMCDILGVSPPQLFDSNASPQNIQTFSKEVYIEELSSRLLEKLSPLVRETIRDSLK